MILETKLRIKSNANKCLNGGFSEKSESIPGEAKVVHYRRQETTSSHIRILAASKPSRLSGAWFLHM